MELERSRWEPVSVVVWPVVCPAPLELNGAEGLKIDGKTDGGGDSTTGQQRLPASQYLTATQTRHMVVP